MTRESHFCSLQKSLGIYVVAYSRYPIVPASADTIAFPAIYLLDLVSTSIFHFLGRHFVPWPLSISSRPSFPTLWGHFIVVRDASADDSQSNSFHVQARMSSILALHSLSSNISFFLVFSFWEESAEKRLFYALMNGMWPCNFFSFPKKHSIKHHFEPLCLSAWRFYPLG